ncbi:MULTISPECIES: TonB-dependent copper receptor [Acinetobacter]|uniref:TonB-dependent copper receptor n=1 Tax=Acinetobacter TaxID=469 RepID=UPI00158A9D91|nr:MULTISPECIES: TonB-dependent copper receptor [Acinetobacter]MCU4366309.1 TonB-dependent copper receptor [Acinetobacter variabilis]MCU4376333.1 TonB-dependent copper receptor [Acinetobacter variabilis]QKW81447.1 TonB-dependent copper receptor [Acinetobacter sp. FDAARGOS_724]UXI51642.1 TonB-dependent copper receptor [Acinetobacter variabilis]
MAQPKFSLQPLAAAICVACYSSMVLANEAMPVQTMAPIVVTSTAGNDANGLIVRADPKQPIQPVPATDGADYLQSIVGFSSVNSGAGTNGDVTFRGMFGSRIKILTDGTENLGACPSRMDSPTSYISPESYDRISVIKGPQTVQYANTGSAATVIFERNPESFTEDKNYRGQASVLMGSYGRLDHNVEAALGDDKKYIRLNASRSVSDSYKDGDNNKVPSDWERWNTDIALGWTPDENTWLELTGGRGDAEVVYAGRMMDGSEFDRESLGLRVEKKNITDVIKKIEAQVNYSFNDHVMDNYSLRAKPMMEMATNVTRKTLNARMAVTHEWDKLQFITGIDTQNNEHGIRKTDKQGSYLSKPVLTDMEFQSYGGFGELSYQLNDQNKLVTGVRIDQAEVDAVQTAQQRKETLPSGFIRLENQHPHHDAKTYVGLGYVERMPDYWELFSPVKGNGSDNTFKSIDTEKTLQLDLGYQHEHDAFSSWASAYAGLVQDFILTKYNANNKAETKNVDTTIAGAEVGIGYQFTDALQADVSAMYAWGENTTNNTPLPQISPLEGRLNLRYVQDKYTLGALLRVVDGQSRISEREGNIVGYDVKESSGFGVLSLNGSYNLSKGVDVSVGVDNVLDKTYTEHLNKMGASGAGLPSDQQFNNIGRNYWARISMKF